MPVVRIHLRPPGKLKIQSQRHLRVSLPARAEPSCRTRALSGGWAARHDPAPPDRIIKVALAEDRGLLLGCLPARFGERGEWRGPPLTGRNSSRWWVSSTRRGRYGYPHTAPETDEVSAAARLRESTIRHGCGGIIEPVRPARRMRWRCFNLRLCAGMPISSRRGWPSVIELAPGLSRVVAQGGSVIDPSSWK